MARFIMKYEPLDDLMWTLMTYDPGVLAVTLLNVAMPVETSTCSVALSALNVPGASTIESNSSVQLHVSP